MAQAVPEGAFAAHPLALFVGDFNVGKSALINALVRTPLLHTGSEESRSLPTVLLPGSEETEFVAYGVQRKAGEAKTFDEFVELRSRNGRPSRYSALAVRVAPPVFTRLGLVDTPGVSSEGRETLRMTAPPGSARALLVVVADIEYWFAKHTLELIAHHAESFRGSVVVLANKSDLMNAPEIQRVQEKAARRMEEFGISHPLPFLTVSARAEAGRRHPHDDARKRIKRKVRDLCDAAFDQFRLHLYEFEAAAAEPLPAPPLESVLASPLVSSFLTQQQGAHA